MNEEFTLKGIWWLPNREDRKFFGTLHFSPEEGGILELESSFVDLFQLLQGKTSNPDIILGISRDGKEITLYNCLQKSTKWNFSGYPFSSFLIEKIFIGSHFNEKAEIKFKKVGIRYSHLDKWIKTSGFKIQLEEYKENNTTGTIIKYKLPQSIQTKIRKDIGISIDFQVEGLPLTYTREVHIREAPIINLEFPEERPIDEILELINLLQNFLTLGVSKPVIPLMIRGKTKRQMRSESQVTELNFDSGNIKEFESEKIDRSQMFFTFEDIKDRFDSFFNNWIEKKELLSPVYNLYFATLYNKHLYLENKFLNFVQALETYHRRVYDGKYMDNDDYEELRKKLVSAIPRDVNRNLKERLDGYLVFGNEFSLRKRLKDLFEQKPILKDLIDDNNFIQEVVDARNYYVHYDKEEEYDVPSGQYLHELTRRLEICLKVCLLSELGFDQDKIKKMMKRSLPDYS